MKRTKEALLMYTLLNRYLCYSASMSSTFEIGREELVKNLSCRLLVNKSSQLNLLLVAVKRTNPEEPRRVIGFTTSPEPDIEEDDH